MGDLSTGLFALLVIIQIAVLVILLLFAVRLVKIIKSQNPNGKLLSEATRRRMRRGRDPGK
ncbi:MAG TPA: hypothetical protein VHJ78_10400 [Actinomycetota bacterium]|nr:hypothetical protein [Actinomycetota bacterium]